MKGARLEETAPFGRAAVFGGTGFLGRRIVHRLAGDGISVRVVARRPKGAPADGGLSGRIEAIAADVCDPVSVGRALDGCGAVVNAVGLYAESGGETFAAVHEQGARTVADRCRALGIDRLVHVSGIGADLNSASHYVRARRRGELLVMEALPSATILRPSVLFGPDDRFLNVFAEMARRSPVLPLFGSGDTRLQPVFVDDVSAAAVAALSQSPAQGKIYELGGPGIYRYRDLIALVLRQMRRRRLLMPVPFAVWDALAAAASVLPRQPLTRAQVTLMKQDNVVAEDALTLAHLSVEATALEDILPRYAF